MSRFQCAAATAATLDRVVKLSIQVPAKFLKRKADRHPGMVVVDLYVYSTPSGRAAMLMKFADGRLLTSGDALCGRWGPATILNKTLFLLFNGSSAERRLRKVLGPVENFERKASFATMQHAHKDAIDITDHLAHAAPTPAVVVNSVLSGGGHGVTESGSQQNNASAPGAVAPAPVAPAVLQGDAAAQPANVGGGDAQQPIQLVDSDSDNGSADPAGAEVPCIQYGAVASKPKRNVLSNLASRFLCPYCLSHRHPEIALQMLAAAECFVLRG